jgi:diacylglycerol O-acyltransferase / wax synthase
MTRHRLGTDPGTARRPPHASRRTPVTRGARPVTKSIPPLDLLWLLIESPGSTTHVGAMLLFKKPAGRRPVVREIVEAYRAQKPVPPFNYVPELLGGGAPHFREVADWDPHYHIQHLALPAGASYDDLLRLVADLHEPMLDRDRPLFRCWMIDGVPGGRFAMYTKTHHSIIDGASGMQALYAGFAKSARRTVPTPGPALGAPASKPRAPQPFLERISDSIRTTITQVGAFNDVSLHALRKTLAGLVGVHLEGSLPFTAHHAPTNEPLCMARAFATLSLPLEEMHAVGRHFDATLNDVAATIIDAGLHRYLRETGRAFAHRFNAFIPVSLRADGDTAIGTRVSAMFVPLGEPAAPAHERVRQVVASIELGKQELRAMSKDEAMTYAVGIVGLAGLAASTHFDRVAHPAANLVISNVPGAKEPRYLNGARLVGVYPISALAASIGLNVTLTSYYDRMDFGFIANAVPLYDLPQLARHTLDAYQELKAAAGK